MQNTQSRTQLSVYKLLCRNIFSPTTFHFLYRTKMQSSGLQIPIRGPSLRETDKGKKRAFEEEDTRSIDDLKKAKEDCVRKIDNERKKLKPQQSFSSAYWKVAREFI